MRTFYAFFLVNACDFLQITTAHSCQKCRNSSEVICQQQSVHSKDLILGAYYFSEHDMNLYEVQFTFDNQHVTFEFLFHYLAPTNGKHGEYAGLAYSRVPQIPYSFNSNNGQIALSMAYNGTTCALIEALYKNLTMWTYDHNPGMDKSMEIFEAKLEGIVYKPVTQKLHMSFLSSGHTELDRIDKPKNFKADYIRYWESGLYRYPALLELLPESDMNDPKQTNVMANFSYQGAHAHDTAEAHSIQGSAKSIMLNHCPSILLIIGAALNLFL